MDSVDNNVDNNKEMDEHEKLKEQLLKAEARRHIAKLQLPPHNQIDSHKWTNKMEIFRLLSS